MHAMCSHTGDVANVAARHYCKDALTKGWCQAANHGLEMEGYVFPLKSAHRSPCQSVSMPTFCTASHAMVRGNPT